MNLSRAVHKQTQLWAQLKIVFVRTTSTLSSVYQKTGVLRELYSNQCIINTRPSKGTEWIFTDHIEYISKLNDTLNDESKLTPTENQKNCSKYKERKITQCLNRLRNDGLKWENVQSRKAMYITYS